MKGDISVGVFIAMLLAACVGLQQDWTGSAHIQLNNGRTAYCPDGFVTTPVAVACYTKQNGGRNIFTIAKSDIQAIKIGE